MQTTMKAHYMLKAQERESETASHLLIMEGATSDMETANRVCCQLWLNT